MAAALVSSISVKEGQTCLTVEHMAKFNKEKMQEMVAAMRQEFDIASSTEGEVAEESVRKCRNIDREPTAS